MNDKNYWSNHSELSYEYYYSPLCGDVKAELLVEVIKNMLGEIHGKKILKTDLYEDAKGSDQIVGRSYFEGNELVGIDISRGIANQAKENFPYRLLSASCDVCQLCFADEVFDVVLSLSTLDHFDSTEPFINSIDELCRVLDRDGKFLLALDNKYSVFSLVNIFKKHLNLLPFKLGKTYTPGNFRKMFDRKGIQITQIKYGLFVPINFFPRLFNKLGVISPEYFKSIVTFIDKTLSILLGRFSASFVLMLIEKDKSY